MRKNGCIGYCVLLLFASDAYSLPPKVDFPAETTVTGDYVVVSPVTNAKAITYVKGEYTAPDGKLYLGVEPFPSSMLKDPNIFILQVRGLPDGIYNFSGVASLNDEHTKFNFRIIKGPIKPGPIPPIPPGPIPPIPIVEYEGPIRLFIVDETATRFPSTAKTLLDTDFWAELDKQGYIMRAYDVTSADSKRLGLDKIKQTTPFLLITDKQGNVISKQSLPTTREGIRATLPKIKVTIPVGLIDKKIEPINPTWHNVEHIHPFVQYPPVMIHIPTNARMMVRNGVIKYCPT